MINRLKTGVKTTPETSRISSIPQTMDSIQKLSAQ
jgi:hypothetical protein